MQNLKRYFNLKNFSYLIIFLLAFYIGDKDLENLISKKLSITNSNTNFAPKNNEYFVTKIVDGDTVHVLDNFGKEEILRFLAVDTLEKNSLDLREKCLANLESNFTKENLLNKKVLLEGDSTQSERDKYGRLLVYITVVSSTKVLMKFYWKLGMLEFIKQIRQQLIIKNMWNCKQKRKKII